MTLPRNADRRSIAGMITPPQSRAARALLNWSQPELAEASRVSVSTIRDFETGKRSPIDNNLTAIRAALESAGVVFIAQNGGGAGVRLAEQKSDDEIMTAYLPKGPCVIRRKSGGGDGADSLADALRMSRQFNSGNDGVTSVEVLGQLKLYPSQILRLIGRMSAQA
jgi:transcriptional regulator with XRE-family HTH domain